MTFNARILSEIHMAAANLNGCPDEFLMTNLLNHEEIRVRVHPGGHGLVRIVRPESVPGRDLLSLAEIEKDEVIGTFRDGIERWGSRR